MYGCSVAGVTQVANPSAAEWHVSNASGKRNKTLLTLSTLAKTRSVLYLENYAKL